MLVQLLQKFFRLGLDGIKTGTLSELGKSGFYAIASVVCVMAVGYLKNIDLRFESIEGTLVTLSDSVTRLNNNMEVSGERSRWQQKELDRHTMAIESNRVRIEHLETLSRTQPTTIINGAKK